MTFDYTPPPLQLISHELAVALAMERLIQEYLDGSPHSDTPLTQEDLYNMKRYLDGVPLHANVLYASPQDMGDLKQWAAQQEPPQVPPVPLNRYQRRRQRFGPTRTTNDPQKP